MKVAQELNLSSRQLHRIFGQNSTTVMAEVVGHRLQCAMFMLKNPAHASMTVAEIGYRSGFSGPACSAVSSDGIMDFPHNLFESSDRQVECFWTPMAYRLPLVRVPEG